jgi:chitin synthase
LYISTLLHQLLNNNKNVPPVRTRISNAGMNVKDVFDVNGGPNGIYGTSGNVNQAYEPVVEEDRNSLRMQPRNNSQVSWSQSTDRRL